MKSIQLFGYRGFPSPQGSRALYRRLLLFHVHTIDLLLCIYKTWRSLCEGKTKAGGKAAVTLWPTNRREEGEKGRTLKWSFGGVGRKTWMPRWGGSKGGPGRSLTSLSSAASSASTSRRRAASSPIWASACHLRLWTRLKVRAFPLFTSLCFRRFMSEISRFDECFQLISSIIGGRLEIPTTEDESSRNCHFFLQNSPPGQPFLIQSRWSLFESLLICR